MQYPLYDYYLRSPLTIADIFEHYCETFYTKKYGRDKVEKVMKKSVELKDFKKVLEASSVRRLAPNYKDLLSVVNSSLYFMTQSNVTQGLAVLSLASAWEYCMNPHGWFIDKQEFKNNIVKVFESLQIVEDMTDEEFQKGATLDK